MGPAEAMVEVKGRVDGILLTISLDFDERVIRMGYGDMEAVKLLRDDKIDISHVAGLRNALVIVDDEGYTYTPTALYLEAEAVGDDARNALRLSREQVREALARLSDVGKIIAVAQTDSPAEKERIKELPVDVSSEPVSDEQVKKVDRSLKEAPPVNFDVDRQMRVFEPFLQYVKLNLEGVAIQRRRLEIPPSIRNLGGGKDLEGRLRTTFELIAKDSKMSGKALTDSLNEIRKNFTWSLGKDYERVVLKAAKGLLAERLDELRQKLEKHRATVRDNLQKYLDESCQQIADYYLPSVMDAPPDALRARLLSGELSKEAAVRWLKKELGRVFPTAESLVKDMELKEQFMGVTYETLNDDKFLAALQENIPDIDWDKPYNEFRAAAERSTTENTG